MPQHTSSLITASVFLFHLLAAGSVLAKPIPDATLGSERSIVTPENRGGMPSHRIDGGARRGQNLFHSFEQFNINLGEGAFFSNPAGIANILSRITGSSPSQILGTLGVLGEANLFLINPNGIIFGENARLDISGSFVATTGDAIRLGERGVFSASQPETSNLLTINPSAIVFNRLARGEGAIVNRSLAVGVSGELNNSLGLPGGLQVATGQTLALIGRDVALEGGSLTAEAGHIELGSVAGNGEVSLTQSKNGLRFNYNGVEDLGDIQIIGSSTGGVVDVSGEGGGSIRVQGARLEMSGESALLADTRGTQAGRGVSIRATEAIALREASIITSEVFGSGDGGNSSLETTNLRLQDDSFISASTSGQGDAGNLSVVASAVELDSFSRLLSQVEPGATGTGGDISIKTERLDIRGGAQVATSSFGEGNAGNSSISATEIELADSISAQDFSSGLFASAQEGSRGAGGNLTVETKRLVIRDGAQIGTTTFAEGDAGDLTVTASEIVLTGSAGTNSDLVRSGLFAAATEGSTGDAGDLTLDTDRLLVQDGAEVRVSTFGTGKAGNINITADNIALGNEAAITAQSASGNGGNITLQVDDLLELRQQSKISTTASNGAGGDGGNITINADNIIAVPEEDSNITANAFTGDGGEIDIEARGIFGIEFRDEETPQSDITASSEFGVDGIVEINRPEADPSQPVSELPQDFEAPPLARGCQGNPANSFTHTGRGGLPPSPSEPRSAENIWHDWRSPFPSSSQLPEEESPAPSSPPQIIEARGWLVNADGEVVLTARPVEVTPQGSPKISSLCQRS